MVSLTNQKFVLYVPTFNQGSHDVQNEEYYNLFFLENQFLS